MKPNGMTVSPGYQWRGWEGEDFWWNRGSSAPNASGSGGGYTADFDPTNGFKPVPSGSTFPTTGFPYAKFRLVMASGQAGYSFSVQSANPAGAVTVDNSTTATKGDVTLISKPRGPVTIRATNGSNIHDYTFNISLWAVPQTGVYTFYTAKKQCGGATNILTRAEMTNSPYNNNINAPPGWKPVNNVFTRAIDGTILSEWGGILYGTEYPGSLWATTATYYWTPEARDSTHQFVVASSGGNVGYAVNALTASLSCKG